MLPYIGAKQLAATWVTDEGVQATKYAVLTSYVKSVTVYEGDTEAVRQVETRVRASFCKGDPRVGFYYDFGSGNFYEWRMSA